MFEPEELFFIAEDTAETRSLVERVQRWSRVENRAAARRLDAIADVWETRLRECGDREDWVIDAHASVTAEVAAALCVSQGRAGSYLNYARAMRERLPRVAEVFLAGEVDLRLFQTMVYRTDLITDAAVLAAVDRELSDKAPRWPSLTPGRLAGYIDTVVARADADAVRRRRDRQTDRDVWIGLGDNGIAEIHGNLWNTDGQAIDKRLTALAATVCDQDPRTTDQRRADALGVLAAGGDRLGCLCDRDNCPAGGRAASAVVVHVVAEAGTGAAGTTQGADGLIPPELLAHLARSATLMPLTHPGDAAPESGYTPSRALADFVRCRDMTCRFPGCDRPAMESDIDHTVAYGEGGRTHASNLKCLCRVHHLVKTFWGWHDKQLRDGTVLWTSPAGDSYVTLPGSAALFPGLCRPTGTLTEPPPRPNDHAAERSAMMPRREHTRAEYRARRITAERRQNQRAREARQAALAAAYRDEPPPF